MTYLGNDWTNINTKVVTPTMCRKDEIAQQNYARFVEKHINKTYARMKKARLKSPIYHECDTSTLHRQEQDILTILEELPNQITTVDSL